MSGTFGGPLLVFPVMVVVGASGVGHHRATGFGCWYCGENYSL